MSEEPQVKLTLDRRWLVVLAALMVVLQVISPYRGWMIVFTALGGALATGYVWARSLADGLELTREMRFGWAQVGDRVEERFTLINGNPLPALWVEVSDCSTMPGYDIDRVATMGGQDATRWRTRGICRHRGVFTLGPTRLLTADPLGVFRVELRYATSMPFVVVPPIVSLPSIEVASGGRAGAGRPRPNAPERTVSTATVREYLPGDSPRWIHWRTSARRDDLYVRLFEGVPAGDWWIVVDLNRAVQVGEGLDATDEHGIVLAASLADRGLQRGRQVGLVAQGEELIWLPPRRGEARRWEILRALAVIRRGDRDLARILARAGASLGRYASLIVITPDPTSGWVESLVPLMRQDIVPTVLLLDRATFQPGSSGVDGRGQDVRRSAALLSAMGIAHHVIGRDMLGRSDLQPGEQGRWEWRVLGTGHAVPVRRPQETAWKALS